MLGEGRVFAGKTPTSQFLFHLRIFRRVEQFAGTMPSPYH